MALRNRTEKEEAHLKGVFRNEEADPTKIQLGTCEGLQNTIQGGINSWQKKRGPRWLGGQPPQEIDLGYGISCPLATTELTAQSVVCTLLVDQTQFTNPEGHPSGSVVNQGCFAQIHSGGSFYGFDLDLAQNFLGIAYNTDAAQWNLFTDNNLVTGFGTQVSPKPGVGNAHSSQTCFCMPYRGDDDSIFVNRFNASGNGLGSIIKLNGTVIDLDTASGANGNTGGLGGTDLTTMVLKQGNVYYAINGSDTGQNAMGPWRYDSGGTETHYSTAVSLGIWGTTATISDNYLIVPGTDGLVNFFNLSNLTLNHSWDLTGYGIDGLNSYLMSIWAVSDTLIYGTQFASNNTIIFVKIKNGVLSVIDSSVPATGVSYTKSYISLGFVDGYYYFMRGHGVALWRIGPFHCP